MDDIIEKVVIFLGKSNGEVDYTLHEYFMRNGFDRVAVALSLDDVGGLDTSYDGVVIISDAFINNHGRANAKATIRRIRKIFPGPIIAYVPQNQSYLDPPGLIFAGANYIARNIEELLAFASDSLKELTEIDSAIALRESAPTR